MIRGVSIAGGGFLLGRAITLVTFVVLARLITPEELGQYTSGSILVGFGLLLAGSGMLAALIHREDRLDEAASTATVATIGAGVILALSALAAAPLFGVVLRKRHGRPRSRRRAPGSSSCSRRARSRTRSCSGASRSCAG